MSRFVVLAVCLVPVVSGCSDAPRETRAEPVRVVETVTDEGKIKRVVGDWLESVKRHEYKDWKRFFWENRFNPPSVPNALRSWDFIRVTTSEGDVDIAGDHGDLLGNAAVRVEYSDKEGHPLVNDFSFSMRRLNGTWRVSRLLQ
jgi:hypothetical protein